ncbi:hypothetical protein EsH8_XIII_000015 [Colletotrichum jinshuiense]
MVSFASAALLTVVGALPSWSALATQLVLFAAGLLLWRYFLSPLRGVPGPFLAKLTRLWHIHRILKGDQNLALVALHDQYGHFVRLAPDEVSVAHPDAVHKLFLAPLTKGYWYAGFTIPDWRYVSPMAIVDPRAKIELSKALSPGYALSNVLQSEEAVGRLIERLMDWMDVFARDGTPMALDKYLSYTTLDIVGEVVFSKPFGFPRTTDARPWWAKALQIEEGRDIDNTIRDNATLTLLGAVTPYFRRLRNLVLTNPVMTWLGLLPTGGVYHRCIKAINERLKDPDARFDLVAHWFRTMKQSPERLNLKNIQAQTTNTVVAGSDTVSTGVQSFLYHLLRAPDALSRVRAEMAAALAAGRCRTRVVAYADARQLPYLQACVKEALRVHSPVSIGLPRVAPAPAGLEIGGRHFPPGTVLSVNPWVVHLSPEIWGPDAREFNPDRWLRDDAARLDKYILTFGAGYESCPGHNVAKMELSKITATIIRDYNIRQVTPGQEWSYKAAFVAAPHSWPVYVEKRQS